MMRPSGAGGGPDRPPHAQAAAADRARPVAVRRRERRVPARRPRSPDRADPQRAHRRGRVRAAPVRRRRPAPPRAARCACPRPRSALITTTDRRRLFVTSAAQDETVMIDTERLRRVRRWPVGDAAGSVSPDGRLFALGSSRGEVRVLDLRSGRVRRFTGGKPAAVIAARVHARSADARDFRTTTDNCSSGTSRAANSASSCAGTTAGTCGDCRSPPTDAPSTAPATTNARSCGTSPAIAGSSGASTPGRRSSSIPATGRRAASRSAPTVAPSPSRRPTARVDLIDAQTLRPRRSVHALDGFAAAVAFSPDGQLLAIAGKGGQVTLWDARSLQPAGDLSGLSTTSQALAFSPDGEPARRRRARHADRRHGIRRRHRARVGRAPARPHRVCASR